MSSGRHAPAGKLTPATPGASGQHGGSSCPTTGPATASTRAARGPGATRESPTALFFGLQSTGPSPPRGRHEDFVEHARGAGTGPPGARTPGSGKACRSCFRRSSNCIRMHQYLRAKSESGGSAARPRPVPPAGVSTTGLCRSEFESCERESLQDREHQAVGDFRRHVVLGKRSERGGGNRGNPGRPAPPQPGQRLRLRLRERGPPLGSGKDSGERHLPGIATGERALMSPRGGPRLPRKSKPDPTPVGGRGLNRRQKPLSHALRPSEARTSSGGPSIKRQDIAKHNLVIKHPNGTTPRNRTVDPAPCPEG